MGFFSGVFCPTKEICPNRKHRKGRKTERSLDPERELKFWTGEEPATRISTVQVK